MASTSRLCPADRLQRRADLVVRPLPEIGMCMVYRPRPARIVTLNPASWLLFEACTGRTVAQIGEAVASAQARPATAASSEPLLQGLQSLLDLALVERCLAHAPDHPSTPGDLE